jgi:DNA-binding NarL/FixJ family response regulator
MQTTEQMDPSLSSGDTDPITVPEGPEKRGQYIIQLYEALGRAPDVPLPAVIVCNLLERLPSWDLTTEDPNRRSQVHYLSRNVMDSTVKLELSTRPTASRSVHRDKGSITIRVADAIRGRDLRTLIEIESQIPAQEKCQFPKDGAAKFRETKGVYAEGESLTDRDILVLGYTTHASSTSELAKNLEITRKALNKILHPIMERVGIPKTPRTSIDSYIYLTLVAVAIGVADIKPLPGSLKDELDNLTKKEREVLTGYFSPDPLKAQAVRDNNSSNTISVMWSNLCQKIGASGKHEAALIAVKQGILELPDAAVIKQKLAETKDPVKP